MKVLRWLEEGASYFIIAVALGAGLAASYGRELEAQRQPDRSWWIRRFLIMPILAVGRRFVPAVAPSLPISCEASPPLPAGAMADCPVRHLS